MKNNALSPLFLQSVIGPFPRVGSVGSAVPLQIKNPNKTAMLIDQLRFSFRADTIDNIPAAYYTAIAIETLLGAIPLTKQHVTLGALAPRYFGLQPQVDNLFGPQGDSGLTWHLPKPLYVPPDVQLMLNVKRQESFPGDTGGAVIPSLAISVVGRSLPDNYPIPGSIYVPWVTETKCNTNVASFVSSDADLVNSNNVPLHVNQFVGINFSAESFSPTQADLRVQMSLSNGTLLVRDPIPFFLAFPEDRGILPINAVLQPGAFVRLELETSVPPTAEGFDRIGFTAVAMHGYREIQTPGTFG